MKYLNSYHIFESLNQNLSEEQIDFINKYTSGTWEVDLKTGLVNIKGDFNFEHKGLNDMKGIKFGTVEGNFNCNGNRLTTLEGSPRNVEGDFKCCANNLTNLDGGPLEVKKDFFCFTNYLTTLQGSPHTVGGDFFCSENKLTDLYGSPRIIGGSFACNKNYLTSLEGSPERVGSGFSFSNNKGVNSHTLESIWFKMYWLGINYKRAVESVWKDLPAVDKGMLYSPDFLWLDEKERKVMKALQNYYKIKDML